MPTNVDEMFLFPVLETNEQGDVVVDNRDQMFTRTIHPSEVDLRKYIANRDEYLYFDITSQAEKEFDTILHQDCLCRQDEAWKAHFFKQGLPGYQPFLLQDGVFSMRSRETNYRYQCVLRVVHPVSTPTCYNKLPVVLLLPQHLALNTVAQLLLEHHLLPGPGFATALAHRVGSTMLNAVSCRLSDSSGMDLRHARDKPSSIA